MLTITSDTARRFILGKQGLWPGRRGLRRSWEVQMAHAIHAPVWDLSGSSAHAVATLPCKMMYYGIRCSDPSCRRQRQSSVCLRYPSPGTEVFQVVDMVQRR